MIELLVQNLQENPSNAVIIIAILYLILEGRGVKKWVGEGFASFKERFEKVDERIETHFGKIDEKIQTHMSMTEKRMEKHNGFDRRIAIIEGRCAALHEEKKQ